MTVAQLEFLLKLKSDLGPGINAAMSQLDGLRARVKEASAALAAGFAAGAAAAAVLGRAIADLAGRAERISNISKTTGLAVESVQQLQRVMASSGGSVEQLGTAIKFLQKNLAESDPAFKALGLNVEELKAAKPEEALQKWAEAMASIEDPAERTAAAMATAGRSGTDLLPVIDQLAAGSSALATSLSGEQIEALGALDDQIDAAAGGLADLRDQFLAAIAASPAVVDAVRLIADAMRGLAEAVREVTPAIQGFVNATLGGLANAGAKLAAFVDEFKRGHGIAAAAAAAAGTTFTLGADRPTVEPPAGPSRRFDANFKASAEAAKKATEEADKLQEVLLESDKTLNKTATETWALWEKGADVAQQRAIDGYFEMAKEQQRMNDAIREQIEADTDAAFAAAGKATSESFGFNFKAGLKDLPQVILGALQGGGNVGESVGASLFGSILKPGNDLVKNLTGKLSGILGEGLGSALGSIIPGLGTLLGSQLGGLLSKGLGALGIGGNKQIMEVNKLRDSFLSAQGGFEAFSKKMSAVSKEDWAKKIFNAKTVEDFNRLVREAQDLLDTQGQAQEALNAAVEKYGFTVDELGPKFRQQELDAMAGELLQDYELLKASGIDLNLINEKMAPNMSEYVQTAIKAGSTIPEAMRPVIEAMIANGQLLDENGEAYASAEAAGITFAQTMSEQFSTLIQKIGDLVAALTGIPNVDRTVTVTTHQNTGSDGSDYGGVPEDYRAASGFHAMVTRPTRILVGEAGPERVDVTPQGSGGGGMPAGTQITFAPSFAGDPLQTNEARADLSRYQIEEFYRQARNSPLLRATLQQNGRRK